MYISNHVMNYILEHNVQINPPPACVSLYKYLYISVTELFVQQPV